MNQKTYISPSLLAANFSILGEEIASAEKAGADWLHIDVMDGHFVPPITFGECVVSTARSLSSLELDVHLMICEPDHHLESFRKSGADRLTVHYEACPHLHRTLGRIRELGIKNGVAINPGTAPELLFPVLDITDMILVMTVNPGWGGQKFIDRCLSKISVLKNEITRRGLDTIIQVDGGVTDISGRRCVEAGATSLVAGTYIFKHPDRADAIQSLRAK